MARYFDLNVFVPENISELSKNILQVYKSDDNSSEGLEWEPLLTHLSKFSSKMIITI